MLNPLHAESLSGALRAARLRATPRRLAQNDWDRVVARLDYIPVPYSQPVLDYHCANQRAVGRDVHDLSLVLFHDNKPCGIWPLLLTSSDGGEIRLGGHGGGILSPLFVSSIARKSVKTIISSCFEFLCQFGQLVGQSEWESAETVIGGEGFGDWHCTLMEAGASCAVRHELFIDLSLGAEEIKGNFRKSYKSLVTSGSAMWQVGLLVSGDQIVWDEFHALHREVAGGATRGDETWSAQHAAIADGNGFLVYLRDQAGRMVGGGFFQTTQHEAVYATAAYDRGLFDKPLGHVVQFHSIVEMKRRGIRWYNLGARPYSGDQPLTTEKEISIARFKQGFATHVFPRYILKWK